MTTTAAWEQTGRDGAREDIAAKGEPCATLDEARRRCAAWLRGVEGADVDAAARGYLATWQAHAQGSALPLDLDAVEARASAASAGPLGVHQCGNAPEPVFRTSAQYTGSGGMSEGDARFFASARADVLALVARVRRLEALRDDLADAFDGLVMKVWRAAGETHEPPADVAALLARVEGQAAAHGALLDVVEAIDGVRPASPAATSRALAGYASAQLRRLRNELSDARGATSHARADRDAAQRDRAEAIAAARREGAEAMREACVARAKDHVAALKSEATEAARGRRSDASRAFGVAASAAGSIVDALRVLPLPGGEP